MRFQRSLSSRATTTFGQEELIIILIILIKCLAHQAKINLLRVMKSLMKSNLFHQQRLILLPNNWQSISPS
ncbi:hypothetical protein FGO68_gene6191 [Halteria grandinella]|uniref:Uncharacterized protein n=1 Tax=Halteria grandinella TaxID=5974 RepID=A0A8J8P0M9_HALGN|nr:hypothetical protein FGO68_gene6191 [Halteria grandinella]